MTRFVATLSIGLLILIIGLPIMAGFLGDFLGSRSPRTAEWFLNLTLLIATSIAAGYFARNRGWLMGLILSFAMVLLTIVLWRFLLDVPAGEIVRILSERRVILSEFFGYIVIGTICGGIGTYLRNLRNARR